MEEEIKDPQNVEYEDVYSNEDAEEISEDEGKIPRKYIWGIVILSIILIASVVYAVSSFLPEKSSDENTYAPTETTTATAAFIPPDGSWEMVEAVSGSQNNWFVDGIPGLKTAETDAEAEAAVYDWVELSKQDPDLLTAMCFAILAKTPDKDYLFESYWSTIYAIEIYNEIIAKLNTATITKGSAPTDWWNSHVDEDGKVVSSDEAVISGDRTAAKIDLGNKEVVYVMARCGNIVTPDKIPDEPVVTTQPATTTTKPSTTAPATTKPTEPSTTAPATTKPTEPSTTAPATTKPATTLTPKHWWEDPFWNNHDGDGGGTNANTGTKPPVTANSTSEVYTWVNPTQGTTWRVTTTVKPTTTVPSTTAPATTVPSTTAPVTTTKVATTEPSEVDNSTTVVHTSTVTRPGGK